MITEKGFPTVRPGFSTFVDLHGAVWILISVISLIYAALILYDGNNSVYLCLLKYLLEQQPVKFSKSKSMSLRIVPVPPGHKKVTRGHKNVTPWHILVPPLQQGTYL